MHQKIEVIEHGMILGSSVLMFDCGTWLLHAFRLKDESDDKESIIEKLLSKSLLQIPESSTTELLLHDRYDKEILDAIVKVAVNTFGFSKLCDKNIYSLSLETIPCQSWESQTKVFTYETLETLGFDFFADIYSSIQRDSADPYANVSSFDPAEELTGYKDPSRYIPDFWLIAFQNDHPVGMVLPAQSEGDGVIQFLGVMPSCRKKGYGSILHRKALLMLKEHGLTSYFGSTGSQNHSMISIFEENGCTRDFVQHIYRMHRD